MATVQHPTIPSVRLEVSEYQVDEWLEQGWLLADDLRSEFVKPPEQTVTDSASDVSANLAAPVDSGSSKVVTERRRKR